MAYERDVDCIKDEALKLSKLNLETKYCDRFFLIKIKKLHPVSSLSQINVFSGDEMDHLSSVPPHLLESLLYD